MLATLKRVLVGRPLASHEEEHQRLLKTVALAVFSSDAISSTAYATEEILHVLIPSTGMDAFKWLVPISIVVAILLAIVAASYRQTIFAYPSGGGSYVVAKENLGQMPSLVAGASLLVDYVLTVAVSVSAGVAAILSAVESLRPYRVELCLVFVAVLTLANLRGLKESGTIFAIPTYLYIVVMGTMIGVGLWRIFGGGLDAQPVVGQREEWLVENTGTPGVLPGIALLLLMRAFSSGAVALTGVEAISNGVPAFRRPESRNAATTLTAMALILGTYFVGISVVANRLKPIPNEDETVISQLGEQIFGGRGLLYVVLTVATAAILLLAANTAYADFPRLSQLIARDGYLPRQLATRGDRLVFSNGVVALAVAAGLLLVAFGGLTNALIPLYAVGVFLSFTISQAGMVLHHRRLRERRWQLGLAINVVGATATFAVLWIVVISKFTQGAWVPVVLIPLIVALLKGISRHYTRLGAALAVEPGQVRPISVNNTVIVLVGNVHRGVLPALAYAESLRPNHLLALYVASDEEEQARMQQQWAAYGFEVPLEILYSPYRDLNRSVLRYVDDITEQRPRDVVTVIIPEFVVNHWWEHLLHNQSALLLKGRLLFRRNTVVTSIPYHVS
ncbi:MAG: amino acid permease [Acidimicrobiia bacterium]|nr:amino acid permease [Acidimicrobiia bacterium]